MIKTSNTKARQYVEQFLPFRGNNIYATHIASNGTTRYVVYSYGDHFAMFVAEWRNEDGHEGAVWYENNAARSVTSSKHTTQCRPRNVELIPMDWFVIQGIAKHGLARTVVCNS